MYIHCYSRNTVISENDIKLIARNVRSDKY